MKITDTARYLSLALDSLESSILPEVVSSDAKANGEILRQVLQELLKRERFTPRLLEEQIAEGRVLIERMTALLTEIGATPADNPVLPARESNFSSQSAIYAAINAQIAHLANALVDQRKNLPAGAQQDYLGTLLHKAGTWEADYYSAQRAASGHAEPVTQNTAGSAITLELFSGFLQAQHPAGKNCAVTGFKPIPGGFGKQTYRATVRVANNDESLIVRKSDPTPMIQYGGFFIDQEFELLRSVFATGFPVAEPLFLGKDVPGVDADFYVMQALPGAVPGSFLGAASAAIPESVLLHMAELLAQLHDLKLESFGDFLERHGQAHILNDTVTSCYRRCIADWKAYYERVEHLPSPFLTYLFDWLNCHIPQNDRRPVLVHGDFNIHNVLAEEGRITGVLDWECAMFGAPEQDLAYIRPIISKHIGWDRFIAHYRQAGGPEIDERSMNFYMAFSALRVSVIFNRGTRNLQQGMTRDIRYAVVENGLTPEFMNLALASTAGTLFPE